MTNQNVSHFILTRFNLLLWTKDKEGCKVRTSEWLVHRFELFERYCLPSIVGQTCQDFTWIVLFDSTTPDRFKEKIIEYQKRCHQLIPVFVRPEDGLHFAHFFKNSVVGKCNKGVSKCEKVLTTYLDNDDALNVEYVEDIQRRAASSPVGTFITYDDGYQFFTDHDYVMRIHYPRNHFISVVERADDTLRTVYGYGSHYFINASRMRIEHVKNLPMWCEVIHEKNMGNDAYFLTAKMTRQKNILKNDFSIEEEVQSRIGLYFYRFIPRYVKTFVRRIGYKLNGRHW